MKPEETAPPNPNALWIRYRNSVYGSEPIPHMQEQECSCAFYAGIEAAIWVLADLSEEEDVDKAVGNVEKFRVLNQLAAITQAKSRKQQN